VEKPGASRLGGALQQLVFVVEYELVSVVKPKPRGSVKFIDVRRFQLRAFVWAGCFTRGA
jgi:hypothetical protein